jgi:hypothetical protein
MEPSRDAQTLHKDAERCFRLARNASDRLVRSALTAYGHELTDRAERIEVALERVNQAEI